MLLKYNLDVAFSKYLQHDGLLLLPVSFRVSPRVRLVLPNGRHIVNNCYKISLQQVLGWISLYGSQHLLPAF